MPFITSRILPRAGDLKREPSVVCKGAYDPRVPFGAFMALHYFPA